MATKTLLTLEQFQQLEDDGERHELSAGELVSMAPPQFRHTRLAHRIFHSLSAYVQQNKLGEVFLEAAFLLSENPPTVRVPDVSFVAADRLAAAPQEGYLQGPPVLAVEVVSPSDSAEDLTLKVSQYLAAGCRTVFVLYPKTRQAQVYASDGSTALLTPGQTLQDALLPGWSIRVADLFQA